MSQLDKLHKIRPIKNIDIQTAEDGSVVLWLTFKTGGAFGSCHGATITDALQRVEQSPLIARIVNTSDTE